MRRLTYMLCMMLFCTILAYPFKAEAKTIRVGVFSDTIFSAYDINGSIKGRNIDYLNELKKYTDWSYEYIGYDNFYSAIEGLKKGEVDIVGDVIYSPERAREMAYSNEPCNINTALLLTSNLHQDWTKSRLRKMHEVSIGMMDNYFRRGDLDNYIKNWNVKVNYKIYYNKRDLMNAVNNGSVDFFASHENESTNSFAVFDYFAPKETYYTVRLDNQPLLAELNAAQAKLLADQPDILAQLQAKTKDYGLLLSRPELDYLNKIAAIKIGMNCDQWPLAYYDKSTGAFSGIYVDILKLVESRLNKKIEIVPINGKIDSEFFIKNPEIMAVFGYDISSEQHNYSDLSMSKPLLKNVLQFVGRKGSVYKNDAQVRVVLLREKLGYASHVKKQFPNAQILLADSLQEALDMVNFGEAELFMYNGNVLKHAIDSARYSGLQLVNGLVFNAYTVMIKEQGPDWEFISIINKIIDSLDGEDFRSHIEMNTYNEGNSLSLEVFWLKYRTYILVAIAFWLVNMLWLYYRFRMRLEKQEQYRALAEMSGAIFFEYDLLKKKFYCSEGFERELGHKADIKLGIKQYWVFEKDYPKFTAAVGLLKEGRKNRVKFKFRLRNVDNNFIWYEIIASVMKTRNGRKIIGNMKNIDSVMRDKEQFKAMAAKDQLSGLLNKSGMLAEIGRFLQNKEHEQAVLFFIDIDNFKRLNDTLGHSIGDMAIKDIAHKIRMMFRERDIISRFGGDEFFVFSPNMSVEIMNTRAKELCITLEEEYENEGQLVGISASIGVAWCEAGAVITTEEMIIRADKAAYISKINGKNTYTIYDEKTVFSGYISDR